jgi:hypothetical protein
VDFEPVAVVRIPFQLLPVLVQRLPAGLLLETVAAVSGNAIPTVLVAGRSTAKETAFTKRSIIK